MTFPFVILIIVASIIVFFLFLYFVPVNLWITAIFSNVKVSILDLILMRLRKVPPSVVVNALINGTKAGLSITSNDIETHYLAGGNVNNVIKALISADKANIPLTFKTATAIDLAGRDVFDADQLSVNPRVIDTPPVSAMAKNDLRSLPSMRTMSRYLPFQNIAPELKVAFTPSRSIRNGLVAGFRS